MPVSLLNPIATVLVASATQTATGNSTAFVVPYAESYFFILDCTAISSGTTLDVTLQTNIGSPANTTGAWYGFAKFAQLTTSTIATGLRLQPTLGRGEAASAPAVGSAATDLTAGSAIINNVPFMKDMRARWVIAGTSYTFSINLIAQPRDSFAY